MRGRKPKPTALKILAGKPGHRPLPVNEPAPRGNAVVPKWLSPVAVSVWEDLAPELQPIGLLTPPDAEQFGTLCTLIAEYRADTKGMQTSRITLMKALFAEFGMGPSARTRIQVKPQGQDEEKRFFA